MAEPFKNVFNPDAIAKMGDTFTSVNDAFDNTRFLRIATTNLDDLSLKQRSEQIVQALVETLPKNFASAADWIAQALSEDVADHTNWTVDNTENTKSGIHGWLVMPLTEFVGQYGLRHFALSMELFHAMTQRFSAEFGIRHFLLVMPQPTLSVLMDWTQDESVHVRRLVSEGTRPTLPWGLQLPDFLADPTLTQPLLERLKDDPEEYVRRSVANHLNDMSKKHPDWLADLAEDWSKDASMQRIKLLRHACRSLFKQGHPKVLSLFGYHPVVFSNAKLTLVNHRVIFGDSLDFTFSGEIDSQLTQSLMVDFVIHHQKANGTLSAKVFKWKTIELKPNQTFCWQKKHAFKPITTRKYYAGPHKISVVVNGQCVQQTEFELVL